jgi:8-oxo-dGTP diphosphatase
MARADQKVIPGRYQVVPRTLCFVTFGDEVLLLRGAEDKSIWPAQYNGVGGHVEADEDVLSAAAREIREETGLEVDYLRLRGVINAPSAMPQTGVLLFVFTAQARSREVQPSSEGSLEWVSPARLDGLRLVEDIPVLLRRALRAPTGASPFFARYVYDASDRLHVMFSD